jgi:hypothetical protein
MSSGMYYFCGIVQKKVKKYILAASSLVLSLMVLASAIGLTLNVHYCNTTGMVKKSIIPVTLDCEHEGTASCTVDASASADTTSCCTGQTKQQPEQDCCDDFIQYIKLLSDFDLPKVKQLFNTFVQATIRVLEFLHPASAGDKTSLLEPGNSPPLPMSAGKQFVLACHQLKTEPHIL